MWPYVCGVGIVLFILFVYSLCAVSSSADAAMKKALEELNE